MQGSRSRLSETSNVPGMPFELVLIGGGNMGAALLGGLLSSGLISHVDVAVVEKFEARRIELVERFPGVTISAEIPECTSVVLAVKPPDVAEVAAAAVKAGARRMLSIAAGVTTDSVLRTMPNTPALVGQGVSALAGAPGSTDADLDWAEEILAGVGMVVRVDESQLDAVTGLTGSGPAYVFLVAEALIEAGIEVGLPEPTVQAMVAQLLVGSAALLEERGDPAALRVMVTSPGGTTAAGLAVLEDRAVREAIKEAVAAATARSRELGQL
jgi:pyrroline-5-carboxylate reductase